MIDVCVSADVTSWTLRTRRTWGRVAITVILTSTVCVQYLHSATLSGRRSRHQTTTTAASLCSYVTRLCFAFFPSRSASQNVYASKSSLVFTPSTFGISCNNSLVGGRARAEVWTPAPECITLYCTWCPSAWTNRLHGQVNDNNHYCYFDCFTRRGFLI